MHKLVIEDSLKKKLSVLHKKDRVTYEVMIKKVDELLTNNPNHYKNLRVPLQDFKRVHIRGSFVLIFKYDASKDEIILYDFDAHDEIYKI